ncbi:hypothetical protein OG2516_01526 [Oceanicola granulosus HTCC2516]|uniref:Uncharacterized protein n=2 Tax=Rhodobacterales TaxID=204455 RepID=A3TSF4_PSEBH|nr:MULTISPECIES: hypothetical protein [Rhodobacterales]EAQ04581.1 hypothetical protein OB2597_04845 [Pseudooceanicola batsensis HTCC2597]EAR51558.1 hypothetical protein OG2516_01526 [Oceanicola granulosus HTCC2516]
MHHDIKNDMRATLLAAEIRRQFIAWLKADGDRLVAAADLLGGAPWAAKAQSAIDALADQSKPEEIEDDLIALHRLLMLDFTDDLDSPEAICFIGLHPDDPRADDARLCAEALERGLKALRACAAAAIGEAA